MKSNERLRPGKRPGKWALAAVGVILGVLANEILVVLTLDRAGWKRIVVLSALVAVGCMGVLYDLIGGASPWAVEFTRKLLEAALRSGFRVRAPRPAVVKLLARLRLVQLLAERKRELGATEPAGQASEKTNSPDAEGAATERVETLAGLYLLRRGAAAFCGVTLLVITLVLYVVGVAYGRIDQGIAVPILLGLLLGAIVVDQVVLTRRVQAGLFGSSPSEVRELLGFIEATGRRWGGGEPPRMVVSDIRVPESNEVTAEGLRGAQLV